MMSALTEQEFQDHMRSLHHPEIADDSAGLTFPSIGVYSRMRRMPRRPVECADGFTMSVQAGWGKYSSPRDDYDGNYTAWECGFPSADPITEALRECAEDPSRLTDTVYGYVPTAVVIAEIQAHGGLRAASPTQPPGE
jgi:hypothetical protein